MSHYIYKKKLYLESSKGDILPLALYADSSIRNQDMSYNYHWCINNICCSGLIAGIQNFKEKAEELYRKEIRKLEEFQKNYDTDDNTPCGPESYTYYGNSYPGGRKMKHMKAFYSVKKTIPMQEFLQKPENHFCINLSVYDPKTFQTLVTEQVAISGEVDVYKAQEMYQGLRSRYPHCEITIGVNGLNC